MPILESTFNKAPRKRTAWSITKAGTYQQTFDLRNSRSGAQDGLKALEADSTDLQMVELQTKFLEMMGFCAIGGNTLASGKLQRLIDRETLKNCIESILAKVDEDTLQVQNQAAANKLLQIVKFLVVVYLDTALQDASNVQDNFDDPVLTTLIRIQKWYQDILNKDGDQSEEENSFMRTACFCYANFSALWTKATLQKHTELYYILEATCKSKNATEAMVAEVTQAMKRINRITGEKGYEIPAVQLNRKGYNSKKDLMEEDPIVQQMKNLLDKIEDDKNVQARIKQEKDALVSIVLNVENNLKEQGRPVITFDKLAQRMANFVKASMENPERQDACGMVLTIFELLLKSLKEKSSDSGSTGELEEANNYQQMQTKLSTYGFSEILYMALTTDADGVLFQKGLDLGIELLLFGNSDVQESLVAYAQNHDAKGLFFQHLRERIRDCSMALTNAKVQNNSELATKTGQQIKTVFKFLKELCEGHFRPMQVILRGQDFNRTSYDLIQEVVEFLKAQIDESEVKKIKPSEVEVMLSAFDFLIESVLGPCVENQLFIAGSYAIDLCEKFLISGGDLKQFKNKENSMVYYEIVTKSLALLSACLEGGNNPKAGSMIAQRVTPKVLDSTMDRLYNLLERVGKLKSKEKNTPRDFGVLDEKITDWDNFLRFHLDVPAIHLYDMRERLAEYDHLSEYQKKGVDALTLQERTMAKRICSVEICWQKRIQKLFFPIPMEHIYLTKEAQKAFVDGVDFTSRETRLKGFMTESKRMVIEMQFLHHLANEKRLKRVYKQYTQIQNNFQRIEVINFMLAVVMNLLILLSTKESGTIFDGKTVLDTTLMIVLGAVLMLGFFTTASFLIISEFQVVRKGREEEFQHEQEQKRAKKQEKGQQKKSEIYEKSEPMSKSMKSWYCALALYFLCCAIHAVGLSKVRLLWVVGYFIFGGVLLLPMLFWAKCNSLKTPKTKFQLYYVSIYDVVTSSKICMQLILAICCALGFWKAYFFSFLLFEVLSISKSLKNTVLAVTKPALELLFLAVLFIIFLVSFTMIGYNAFGADSFCILGCEDDEQYASSPIDAFWVLTNFGIRAGDIGAAIDTGTGDEDNFYSKSMYMLVFFIIMVVLLFDMVTGTILDKFSELRAETSERQASLAHEHFISGVKRMVYEENDLDFEKLKSNDQFLWHYLYFMIYLKQKDEHEYEGAETYINNCIKDNDISWFPCRTSLELQELGLTQKENSAEEQIKILNANIAELKDTFESRLESMSASIDSIFELLNRHNDSKQGKNRNKRF